MALIQILLLCVALNLDAFCFAFAFGIKKTKLSWLNILTICIIDLFMLGAGLFISYALQSVVQSNLLTILGACILMVLGAYYIISFFIKGHLHSVSCSAAAVADKNNVLSFKEALFLGFVAGIDGFAAGLASSFSLSNIFIMLSIFFAVIFGFIFCGSVLGYKISKKINLDFSWVSGLILIGIGVVRLVW